MRKCSTEIAEVLVKCFPLIDFRNVIGQSESLRMQQQHYVTITDVFMEHKPTNTSVAFT